MAVEPSKTLKSRNYIGLILSQLLASFNDQAIHIVAIFYAGDILVRYVQLADEKTVVSIVTACFILPFFLFSPIAGLLSDKFSKRSIIVFWKLAEVLMMAVAFAGFLLPHLPDIGLPMQSLAVWSAGLVVAAVFLMGTHSAFFVPAKFGVMPEILHPMVLSSGNGVLEGTSFVSQILGTSIGGVLYVYCKGTIDDSGNLILGSEWVIGLVLFLLSLAGFASSLLMQRTPPAAPDVPLTWNIFRPIQGNIKVLLNSRPLALCVLGIAFFLFMTLFLRQSLIYDGEIAKAYHRALQLRDERGSVESIETPATSGPLAAVSRSVPPTSPAAKAKAAEEMQRAELQIAMLVALVGLGVGIGSLLAGTLSGKKVELGLVPIGAVGMVLSTALLAAVVQWPWVTYPCLVVIGASAGFYIVPLYTLLQHRAPKDKKGNLVATSNFINVTGGLIAVVVFYVLTLSLEGLLGVGLTERMVRKDPALLDRYIAELQMQRFLPRILFLTASLMTVGMLVLLCRQLPDFFVRAILWLNSQGRFHLHVDGLEHLPSSGPVILATNCDHFEKCIHVLAGTDRFTRFFLIERRPDEQSPMLRYLTKLTGLIVLQPGVTPEEEWRKALSEAQLTLKTENVVAVTIESEDSRVEAERFFNELPGKEKAAILPVYCKTVLAAPGADGKPKTIHRARVAIGAPLASDTTPTEIRKALEGLQEEQRPSKRRRRRK